MRRASFVVVVVSLFSQNRTYHMDDTIYGALLVMSFAVRLAWMCVFCRSISNCPSEIGTLWCIIACDILGRIVFCVCSIYMLLTEMVQVCVGPQSFGVDLTTMYTDRDHRTHNKTHHCDDASHELIYRVNKNIFISISTMHFSNYGDIVTRPLGSSWLHCVFVACGGYRVGWPESQNALLAWGMEQYTSEMNYVNMIVLIAIQTTLRAIGRRLPQKR